MNKKYNKIFGQVSVAAVATAISVVATGGVVQAAEDVENLNDGTAVSPVTPSVQEASSLPTYTREEAFETQKNNTFPTDAEQNEFLNHVAENNESITVSDAADLAEKISEAVKQNEAVIVIDDKDGVLEDVVFNGKISDEIRKIGSNASSIVAGYGISTVTTESGDTRWVIMPYYEETNSLAEAKEQFITQVSEYVDANYSTDIEKLHAIYSYLGETTVYGEDSKTPSSAPASLILENKAVCEAFAYLYNEIANKVGFNMKYVTGTTNGGVGHAWNLVEIDGKWYNTDATWGNIDRNGENSLETNMSYFLFSDTKAGITRLRADESLPAATDTRFDVLYNDSEEGYAYGGGVSGNLIVSPNTNKIVVFDTETNIGTEYDMSNDDYKIFTTAMIGNELFVTYLAYENGMGTKLKVGKIDITTGELSPISDANVTTVLAVKYTKDGIFVGDTLVYPISSDANVISKNLNVDVQIGNDHTFALQKAYNDYVVVHDTNLLNTIDSVYADFSDSTDVNELLSISTTIQQIKDTEKRNEQSQKYKSHVTYLNIVARVNSFEDLENTALEENLIDNANQITDATLKAKALQLIADKKAELEDAAGEGEDNQEPSTPTNPPTGEGEDNQEPSTPTNPPTGEGEDEQEPSTPTNPPTGDGEDEQEPSTPTNPPTGDGEDEQEPSIPTTPTTPTNPPSTGDGGTNNGGNGSVDNGSTGNNGGNSTVTPPAQDNSSVGSTPTDTNVTPGTNENGQVSESPTNTVPTGITISDNPALENVKVDLPSTLTGTIAVAIDVNENGNIVITSDDLSNDFALTITIPVEKAGKGVLKIRTAKGLEPVAYTVKDGQIIVQLHKAGELVFVDEVTQLKDIDNHWAKDNIKELADRGIITGNTNQEFKPNAGISRAEFAAILARGLGLAEQNPNANFNDVDKQWHAGYVGSLANLGIVNGTGEQFRPNDGITREELFTMFGRALVKTGGFEVPAMEQLAGFADSTSVSGYAQGYTALLIELGIVEGSNNKLLPKNNASKAEVAKMAAIVLEKLGKL